MNPTLVLGATTAAAFGAAFLLWHVAVAAYHGYRRHFTDQARSRLQEVFVFIDPHRVFLMTLAGTVLVPLVLWLFAGDWVAPLLGFVFAVALPRLAYAVYQRRRRQRLVLQLPDVLLMIASSLRSGTSLQIAIDLAIRETPAPLAQELGVVVREQRLGIVLGDALDSMAARLRLEEIDMVVAAMNLSRDIGGNLAETLDRLAGILRAKAVMEGKIRALTSQGKLQGNIVGLLPLAVGVALLNIQHDAMQPLFTTWWGWTVLGIIAALELCGFFWIRKIVNIDV